ncbi:MAG: tetratricopeptide repeat protein [Spirochaetaceae bacterium]|jgi:tetratricopeptide (TPR) repeat protein|nr:tetratricopeptide repeat protein [Spirochaetaceae bacterium]
MFDTGIHSGGKDGPHGFTLGPNGDGTEVRVVFLPVPKSLASKCPVNGFSINDSIPIPVEVASNSVAESHLPAVLGDITIEMIVAGMIRVICRYTAAGKADDEVSRYYRSFVLAFKPDILAEFSAAAMANIKNGAYGRAREAVAALYGLFPGAPEVTALESMLPVESGACGESDYVEAYRLISGGSEEAGMKKLRKFLERHPDSWNGWFMLGWALRRLKRWEDAAACFHKSMEAGGGCPDTSNELAICLMESGDYAGARRHLEKALSEDAENTKLISNLAILELRSGHENEAETLFRKVLDIDPDDPIANKFFTPS